MDDHSVISLQIVGAVVDIHGELSFEDNIVQDLAQLYILSFGQVLLQSGVNITFKGNRGRCVLHCSHHHQLCNTNSV